MRLILTSIHKFSNNLMRFFDVDVEIIFTTFKSSRELSDHLMIVQIW